jgi:hypothetical protein
VEGGALNVSELLYHRDLSHDWNLYLCFSHSLITHPIQEGRIDQARQVKDSHCLQLVNLQLMSMKDTAENEKSSGMHHTSVSGILYHCLACLVELVNANYSVDTQHEAVH